MLLLIIYLAEKGAKILVLHTRKNFASYLSERYRSARLFGVFQVDWQGHACFLSFIHGSLPHLQALSLL